MTPFDQTLIPELPTQVAVHQRHVLRLRPHVDLRLVRAEPAAGRGPRGHGLPPGGGRAQWTAGPGVHGGGQAAVRGGDQNGWGPGWGMG